jgi:hypothetical protein
MGSSMVAGGLSAPLCANLRGQATTARALAVGRQAGGRQAGGLLTRWAPRLSSRHVMLGMEGRESPAQETNDTARGAQTPCGRGRVRRPDSKLPPCALVPHAPRLRHGRFRPPIAAGVGRRRPVRNPTDWLLAGAATTHSEYASRGSGFRRSERSAETCLIAAALTGLGWRGAVPRGQMEKTARELRDAIVCGITAP